MKNKPTPKDSTPRSRLRRSLNHFSSPRKLRFLRRMKTIEGAIKADRLDIVLSNKKLKMIINSIK